MAENNNLSENPNWSDVPPEPIKEDPFVDDSIREVPFDPNLDIPDHILKTGDYKYISLAQGVSMAREALHKMEIGGQLPDGRIIRPEHIESAREHLALMKRNLTDYEGSKSQDKH